MDRPVSYDHTREAGNFTNLAISILKQNHGIIYMEERGKWILTKQIAVLVMMLCGSNESILVKNEEPQRNVGSIQCIYNKLRIKQRLHVDAFERKKNKLAIYLYPLP